MDDRWIVFGGWGIAPDVLRPVFGDIGLYVDVNELMEPLFDKAGLLNNWPDIIIRQVDAFSSKNTDKIAGWSTGAIIACAIAQKKPVKKLVLLSGTPSFCRREGFRFGQRPAIIQMMKQKLDEKGNSVMRDFFLQCGLQEEVNEAKGYDAQTLKNGLLFLEKVDLTGVLKKTEGEALVVHGKDDKVIPYQAGEAIAGMIGGEFCLVEGGHAFFSGANYDEVKRMVGKM
jgi:pimeloyl-ACP methyl ester carboxylesterase